MRDGACTHPGHGSGVLDDTMDWVEALRSGAEDLEWTLQEQAVGMCEERLEWGDDDDDDEVCGLMLRG